MKENKPTKIMFFCTNTKLMSLSLGCGRNGKNEGVNATYAKSFRASIKLPQLILCNDLI